jgi:hypothetical protein
LTGNLKELASQPESLRDVKALSISELLLADGEIDPRAARLLQALGPVTAGNLVLYSTAGEEENTKGRQALERAGLEWLAKTLIEVDPAALDLVAAIRESSELAGRSLTLLFNEAAFDKVNPALQQDRLSKENKYIAVPTSKTAERLGVTSLHKIVLLWTSISIDKTLSYVGDETLYNNLDFRSLLTQPWTHRFNIPLRIFDEIRKAIRAIQAISVSA